MTDHRDTLDPQAWEKEFAPKITGRRFTLSVVIYLIWIGFLAVIAAHRWFISLQ